VGGVGGGGREWGVGWAGAAGGESGICGTCGSTDVRTRLRKLGREASACVWVREGGWGE
jgi:hypothetical protein